MNILPSFQALSLDELTQSSARQSAWLWDGFLMPGCLALLTSQWKSGKTTLVSVLFAKMREGGLLFDRPVRKGTATIISEEDSSLWATRVRTLSLGRNISLISRPFMRRPTADDWNALIDSLVASHESRPLDLVVIDSLAAFLPCESENVAGSMLDALFPLQRLTALGIAVLALHHPKKGEVIAGQASRGSGALPGAVDVLLEMYWHGKAFDGDRRRRLLGFSRFDETPRTLIVELNESRTDYTVHPGEEEGPREWQTLRTLLVQSNHPLTRRELLNQWPTSIPRPDDSTLWRWLDRAVRSGRVVQSGAGSRREPFGYSLGAG